MKNKGKTKRLMWMTTAACVMMFLGMGICLVCGLRAARESIEESCKRDMEVVMEQLEKPYATRLNTSDELTETMERYLFSQGRREIDLAADGRFLSALNGKSVRDVLFVTTDGHYVSVSGRTGWQKMDRENSGRLTAGKTVCGYRSWNGEEAFFVVKPIEPFFVQGEPYDAIALAYTPGSVNGALSFCAYGGQANVCIIRRDGRAVYAADDVWDQDDIFLRYAGAEKATELCTVPNLLGRTASEANSLASNAGLILRFTGATNSTSGSIVVLNQDVEADAQVEPGTVISVQLGDTSLND